MKKEMQTRGNEASFGIRDGQPYGMPGTLPATVTYDPEDFGALRITQGDTCHAFSLPDFGNIIGWLANERILTVMTPMMAKEIEYSIKNAEAPATPVPPADELDQLRFHPAWKAALRHVKEQIVALPKPPARKCPESHRLQSAWFSGTMACTDIIDAELDKTENT